MKKYIYKDDQNGNVLLGLWNLVKLVNCLINARMIYLTVVISSTELLLL